MSRFQRGVPIVGRGASGAIPGTDPLRALIAKENAEEKRRRKERALALIAANRHKK